MLSLLTGVECISKQQLIGSESVWELDSGTADRHPFKTVLNIPSILRELCRVKLALHNIISRLVKVIEDGVRPAGEYRIVVDCGDLNSGIYWLKAGSIEQSVTKKLILIK